MSVNAAVAARFSDILADLGNIPSDRVRFDPKPGTATIDDLIRVNRGTGLCEMVDGTLVEKAMGWRESLLASVLIELLRQFLRTHNLGLVSGPDGFIRILGSQVRGPDVAFTSWARLPNGRVPDQAVPEIVPDLVIEVLSAGNTYAEMARKRREYFHAGVRQVWMVDPNERTVAVYTDITRHEVLDEDATLMGQDILPGLAIPLNEVFGELDRCQPDPG
ncbi:MAG: Uma2 family endonuclease [Pirellulaceae bacterium]